MTQAFNLSQLANKVNTSGQLDVSTGATGTLPVANGGTGAASLTGNSVAITNAGGTALSTVAAGTTGNVLTSNGTTWTSAAASGGQFKTEIFTTPGTWTKPASCSQVRVTVIGGGAGAGYAPNPSFPGSPGGTSSFGSLVSATGGSGFATPGVGTVSTGTALKSGGGIWKPGGYGVTYTALAAQINQISGSLTTPGLTGNPTYSISGTSMAGGTGVNSGPQAGNSSGFGGLAVAICPVSAPVTVTVGTGGAFNPASGNINNGSGIGGAVAVEFVG